MAEFVGVSLDGEVATIRVDRPPANAINRQVSEELRDAALEVAKRDDVRAVVLWGGPEIFAAGADIKEIAEWGPEEIRPVVSALGDALTVLKEIPKVTIAAIEGFALGGGCEVALACDFRFAAQTAQLGLPEITLGVIPGAGGTQRLPRLVGQSRAKELIYTGRRVGAEEGIDIGLVDVVTPSGQAYPRAFDAAARYAKGPTHAVAAAKAALNAAALGDLRTGLGVERDVFVGLFGTEDQREGMRAFLEKREPRFTGA